jgi:transglutaminase-like putative cysteine protease
VPVPTDWPEQQVRIVDEAISPAVKKVRYRTLGSGVKQMTVQIPSLRGGEGAHALVTFEIDRHVILPPENPETFQWPEDIPRELRVYLAPSPYIEVRHPKIVALAKQLRDEHLSAWSQLEAIYDHVRKNVEYRNGKLKGAAAALRDGYGDCEELTSLFVALCRVMKIPARTVWVPNHCYPEFYLVDQAGQGHWFPCQAAGTRDFGGIPEERPILQKGDNFKVPEIRERQRYVAEFLRGSAVRGGGPPDRQFVREIVTK